MYKQNYSHDTKHSKRTSEAINLSDDDKKSDSDLNDSSKSSGVNTNNKSFLATLR